LMDHPNIAKIFATGRTETGRVFFAMDLVQGCPITEFCDLHQLCTEDRLRLFLQVCRAVQHAHSKAIIHRDIKPSNVLVTLTDARPQVKLIDFGVVKSLQRPPDEEDLITGFHDIVGTPIYASPEQLDPTAGGIDTRSDIYSLGILLHELLAGQTPLSAKDLAGRPLEEVCRLIRDTDPKRPSTVVSMLSGNLRNTLARKRGTIAPKLIGLIEGDLDWIVLKALAKDPAKRYETSAAMADDISRHLNHEPIAARPPSICYQLNRFVRRHRSGALTAVALVFMLFAGLAVSLVYAHRASTEATKSRRVLAVLNNTLSSANEAAPQGDGFESIEFLVTQTASRLDQLDDEPEIKSTLCETLGHVYFRAGAYDQAHMLFGKALESRQSMKEASPESLAALELSLAASLRELAHLANAGFSPSPERRSGLLDKARSLARGARESLFKASAPEPLVARAWHIEGTVEAEEGNFADAVTSYQRALELFQKLNPQSFETVFCASDLANALRHLRRLKEAEAIHRRVVVSLQQSHDPPAAGRELMLAMALDNLANTVADEGKVKDAAVLHSGALGLFRAQLKPGHPEITKAVIGLALTSDQQGLWEKASTHYQEALSDRNLPATQRVSLTYLLARAQLALRQLDEAELTAREQFDLNLKSLKQGGDIGAAIAAQHLLVRVLLANGRGLAAESSLEERYRIFTRWCSGGATEEALLTARRMRLATVRQLAAFASETGNAPGAARWKARLQELVKDDQSRLQAQLEPLRHEASEEVVQHGKGSEEAVRAQDALASAMHAAGWFEDAAIVWREALDARNQTQIEDAATWTLRTNLGNCLADLADYQQAEPLLTRGGRELPERRPTRRG
ncbi:MAG: serine/threonine-protein kinase, partial [Verrucomicrobiales bacterium]